MKTAEFSYLQWLDGNLSDDLWEGTRGGLLYTFTLSQTHEKVWPGYSKNFSPRFGALVDKEIIPGARAARAKFYRDNPDQVVPPETAPAIDAPK